MQELKKELIAAKSAATASAAESADLQAQVKDLYAKADAMQVRMPWVQVLHVTPELAVWQEARMLVLHQISTQAPHVHCAC
jgi:hypothetical protein